MFISVDVHVHGRGMYGWVSFVVCCVMVFARAHLLTYLYKQASSVSSIRVSVRGLC